MQQTAYSKILLVCGTGEEEQQAASAAIDLAACGKARLFVLNVVDRMLVNRLQRFTDRTPTEIEIELEEKGWKSLYYVEELSKNRGIPTLIIQTSGMLENEILNEAARLRADLIVMAHPQKMTGQAKRLVQGYVERVIENAACSVLVVK